MSKILHKIYLAGSNPALKHHFLSGTLETIPCIEMSRVVEYSMAEEKALARGASLLGVKRVGSLPNNQSAICRTISNARDVGMKITRQSVLINKPKFLKATRHAEMRKSVIPRSMAVEALSWRSRRENQHPVIRSPAYP